MGSELVGLEDIKARVRDAVDEQRARLREISGFLYENPELGSEELKAVELLISELGRHSFKVERDILGMPTAFCATFRGKGSGLRVAVIAEYDALPGVGHGCGHNLIAASAIGAGVAASKVMDNLDGEVLVVGTPAEEGHGPSGGAKVIMAERGFWDDINAAIMLHPSSSWGVGSRSLGISMVKMEFEGQTSHAAVNPQEGINALNAATLAFMATHMLRQEARRDANLVIHGIISEGGLATNVIPDRAVCDFGVRSSDDAYLDEMVDKVARCAEGAALAMGAKVKVTKKKLYSGKNINEPLVEVLWNNYHSQGVEMKPWEESINGMPMASTDFGDVSQKIPAAGSYISIAEPGTPGHSKQMADATMTERGQEAMIIGTKALAMTLVELLAEPEKLRKAKEFFDTH
ncbi:MAG: M20 family metallopeptidase [Candidatus Bathyarchaeota archaeon]|nr:MAG: M20 family metallopeptidase [Candidatus Bathyarchaeota archaeon]